MKKQTLNLVVGGLAVFAAVQIFGKKREPMATKAPATREIITIVPASPVNTQLRIPHKHKAEPTPPGEGLTLYATIQGEGIGYPKQIWKDADGKLYDNAGTEVTASEVFGTETPAT